MFLSDNYNLFYILVGFISKINLLFGNIIIIYFLFN